MRLRLIQLFLLSAILFLSACGWHLRGWHTPVLVTEVNLQAKDRYAPLTIALKDAMQQRGINSNPNAPLHLELGNEVLHKRTVAVTSIGSPSQYELSLSVEYRFWRPGQQTPTTAARATANRVFDFNPSNTVAKTQEENTLLDEMRRELAHNILAKAPAN